MPSSLKTVEPSGLRISLVRFSNLIPAYGPSPNFVKRRAIFT